MDLDRRATVEARLPFAGGGTGASPAINSKAKNAGGRASAIKRAVSDLRAELNRLLYVGVPEGRKGQAYDEQAFRDLLTIERKRSDRSGCPFLLLLVDLSTRERASARIDSKVAGTLFSCLWRCLRETDFVGWYLDGHMAGAVLTELEGRPATEVSRLISQRVSEMLCERLPSDVVPHLRVRFYQHSELEKVESGFNVHSGR